MITNNSTHGINKFPDEMISNEKKKLFSFAKEYASAIWSLWSEKYFGVCDSMDLHEQYAIGKHPIERLEKNITNNGKLIKKEFLRYDPKDRIKFLPRLLRNFYNSVDFSEFVPVARAIDESATEIRAKRKEEKLKLFHAKDFIEEAAALNGGMSPIPLNKIPNSKEQIQLEEEAAKPLRVERGEIKAIQFVALTNNFHIQQKKYLQTAVEKNLVAARIDTDVIEGIKITPINPYSFIFDDSDDTSIFYDDARYFGEIKSISIGMLKNIAAESGLKFTDDEIRKMAKIPSSSIISDSIKVKVMYYAFKTFFQDVFKKKVNRDTKHISLIDRTNDVGTEREYNPKQKSDISEKIVDNYDVWFEGIMVLDDERTILRHRLVKNMPEHKGKILPPYVVCKPRRVGIVEECIPKIDAIQELRLRILHHRNNLKGDITEIDPDAIANIVLNPGEKPLSPQEVLSYYFTMGLAFRRTKDEDGELIQNNRPLSQVPESIPRALIELTNQYISEIQDLQMSFGATQADVLKPDPKTLTPGEVFRMSDNTAMRDYTDALFQFCIKILQTVSSRINDAFEWKHIRDRFIENIGLDDVEAIEQYRKDRKQHYFEVYLDYIPTKQERADFLADLTAHVNNGTLDALDKMELSSIRNPLQARASLRLRLEAKRQQMQQFELDKIRENQNQNIAASNAAYENKAKLSAQEFQQKMELENIKFQNESFLTQKQGEIKIIESNNTRDYKFQIEEFRNKFNADLTAFKKEQDAKLRKEIQQISAENQAKMIKLRKGEISDIGDPSTPEVDLSNL